MVSLLTYVSVKSIHILLLKNPLLTHSYCNDKTIAAIALPSSASSIILLGVILIMIITTPALAITTQKALAASWSTEVEDWLNGGASTWAILCESASRLYQYIPLTGYPQLIKMYDQLLPMCDNNLLIIYKDVCPSHNNGFKVCGEPTVYQYLLERKLLSAKTPVEWKIPTPEQAEEANTMLRSFANRIP